MKLAWGRRESEDLLRQFQSRILGESPQGIAMAAALVFAADVVYDEGGFHSLVESLAALSSPDSHVFLGYRQRTAKSTVCSAL